MPSHPSWVLCLTPSVHCLLPTRRCVKPEEEGQSPCIPEDWEDR